MPLIASPSSSPVSINFIDPLKLSFSLINSLTACIKHEIPPFISDVPLPTRKSFFFVSTNGSDSHCASSPDGTTSVCPINARHGEPLPYVEIIFFTEPYFLYSVLKLDSER